ncbi:hypothetical protein BU17DRAFT_72191 [Hysterangium stoloniferum]|nr:hypothetical protein BU17DRAFT_72191 [Hysterangium stoloniferum]
MAPPGLGMAEDMSDTIFDLFQTALQDILWMITQIATLNLILHVWFTMKSTLRAESPRTEKRRTAIIELIPAVGIYGDITISIAQVILILLTSTFDIIVLISFWRRQRLMKRVNMENVTSFAVVIKLLVFSLYGVILSAILLASGLAGGVGLTSINLIAQSFARPAYLAVICTVAPMLAFILLGLGRDILEVWFPCLIKKSDGKYMQMSESSGRSETYGQGHIHNQEDPFDASPPPELS